jgi:hypothetical protein
MADEPFALLLTTGIPRCLELLTQVHEVARIKGMDAIADGALEISVGLLSDVNDVAVEIAGVADLLIVRKIMETQSRNRPNTGNMETHILSLAGDFPEIGSVKVAMLDELDKIVNPNGYGPFWRAQEYGTGSDEVASQVGRVFMGTYEPGGGPPDASQRGQGVGTDAAFISGGDNPGFGTISVEDRGRHFLRDGTGEAAVRYKAAMGVVQTEWVERIRALMAEASTAFAGVKYTRIIRA